MPGYGEAKYWEERYSTSKEKTYDWLESWADVKEIIEQHAMKGLYNGDIYQENEIASKIK